jgi:hypothetical protein
VNAGDVLILSIGSIAAAWGYLRYRSMSAWAREKRLEAEGLAKDLFAMKLANAALGDEVEAGNSERAAMAERIAELEAAEAEKSAATYAVSGVPRAVPWHIRRRELEQSARTKRKKRDEFREIG